MKNLVQHLSAYALVIMVFAGLNCPAATHYVVMPGTESGTPTEPFSSWETAGTNIIEVVMAAQTNTAPRVVWVTNGTYYPTNAMYITNDMQLKSVNGYTNTILNGALATTNRCIYLYRTGGDFLFQGFTVTNYYLQPNGNNGAGIYAYRAKIFDCLITGNKASYGYGAGIFADSTTISNCIIRGNGPGRSGGGVYLGASSVVLDSLIEKNSGTGVTGGGLALAGSDSLVSNCTIINNRSIGTYGGGGIGSYNRGSDSNRKVVSCVITGNTTTTMGGGVYSVISGSMELINCTITGNSATNNGGGAWSEKNMSLRNCLIAQNFTGTNGGGVCFRTTTNTLESCTVVSNYAAKVGGGLYLEVTGTATNNIIYHNTAGVGADNFTNAAGNTGLSYCCVFPAVDGTGNITDDPRLVDPAGGNYRLRDDSPCINVGTNLGWMTTATDPDGHARKMYEIVDMGAYEKIYQGTMFFGH